MATPIENSNDSAMGSMTTDYALYGASTDPLTTAIAQILSKMMGGGTNQFKDLIQMIQASAGIENKGVTMGANLLAGIQRGGASTLTGESSGVGMVGGRDIISFQAASALQQQMLRHYTNVSTGAPSAAARGLDVATLGKLGNMVLSQGAGYNTGPVFKREVLDSAAIDRYTNEGWREKNTTGDSTKLNEALKMKPGDFKITMAANSENLMKLFDEGAKTLAAVKDVLGSEALKDLDATAQTLFGGSMQEFGMRAANLKMASIKASAAANFGGDTKLAAAFDRGAMISLATAMGGEGMSEAEALEQMGYTAAKTSQAVVRLGQAGAAGQVGLEGMGIYGRQRTDTEMQQKTAEDIGHMMREEKAGLALASASQRYAGTMSDKQKAAVEAAMKGLSAGGTAEEVMAARMKASGVLADITGGQSVGGYLADSGGIEEVMRDLRGPFASRFSEMATGAFNTRNQANLRGGFQRNTGALQSQTGMSKDDLTTLGMGAANLSVQDLGKLKGILDKGGEGKNDALWNFLQENGIAEDLEAGGVSTSDFMRILKEQKNGGALGALRGMADTMPGTANHVAAGELRKKDEVALASFMSTMQNGEGTNTGDFATELLKGFTGDKGVSALTLMAQARNRGVAVTDLTRTGNSIDASAENLKKLSGVKGLFEAMGLKEGDTEGLKEAMGSAGNQLKLSQYLSKAGTLTFNEKGASFLDEEETKKQQQIAEDAARSLILGGKTFAKKEGESDEDAKKRFNQEANVMIMRGDLKQGWKGGSDKENWNDNDSLIADYKMGGKNKLNFLLEQGAIGKTGKERLNERLNVQLNEVNANYNKAIAEGNEEDIKKYGERQANLYELQNRLVEGTGGNQNLHANQVNIYADRVAEQEKQKIGK